MDNTVQSPAAISTLQFLGRRPETPETLASLPPESQLALRQFSPDRLLGYGLANADVTELRAAVIGGATWHAAATGLADIAAAQARDDSASVQSKIAYLRRASALLRMSQVMMEVDTPERAAIFTRAADLYRQATLLSDDCQPVLIETPAGPLAGWMHAAQGAAIGSVIVLGGVEGWAMDFDSMGQALAARGMDALMLDGPGQGETRFAHGHYLGTGWTAAFRGAIDFIAQRAPGLPIGLVGNSLGGTFGLAIAVADARIRACCINCAVIRTEAAPAAPGPNFKKMLAFCGTTNPAAAAPVWATIDPLQPVHGQDFPLLIVHGGKDPAVSMQVAETILQRAPTQDKQMTVFSDGDHCVYNHRDDRDALIADWIRERLEAGQSQS